MLNYIIINNRKILLINPSSQAWLLLCKFIIFFPVNYSSIFISFLNSCLFKVHKKDFKAGAIKRSWGWRCVAVSQISTCFHFFYTKGSLS